MLVKLHAAIAMVAPIEGVEIGRREDRATWRIVFHAAATESQRNAAHEVLQQFSELKASKADAVAIIDAAAEMARCAHITPGAGQALTYQRKATERMAYLSAVQIAAPVTREAFPMLWASVGTEVPATGNDALDIGTVAALIGQREAAFAQIGAEIERLRLAAKAAITAATTEAQVRAAAEVRWP